MIIKSQKNTHIVMEMSRIILNQRVKQEVT